MLRLLLVILLMTMGTGTMAEEQIRSITVSGSGFAEVKPDRAIIRMSVVAREPTLDAAQREVANAVDNVLKMSDRMKIDRDNIDTTGASVRPDYRWNREREEQELRGYIAERQVTLELEDLDKLGAVVEGAVKAGVNQVSPPQLDSNGRREAYRRALQAAAEDARANALRLAQSLDAKIGEVISVNAASHAPQPPGPQPLGARMMAAEADAGQTYNPADLSFTATVTVVFAIRPD